VVESDDVWQITDDVTYFIPDSCILNCQEIAMMAPIRSGDAWQLPLPNGPQTMKTFEGWLRHVVSHTFAFLVPGLPIGRNMPARFRLGE
jgi:hypothetical protein